LECEGVVGAEKRKEVRKLVAEKKSFHFMFARNKASGV